MGKESPVLGTWVYTGLEEDGQGQHRRPSLGDWKKMRRVWSHRPCGRRMFLGQNAK